MRVKMFDTVPPGRIADLRAILADMEALAAEIRRVSFCQDAAQVAVAALRVCGMTWTNEAGSWWTPVEPIADEDNERRAMRSTADHIDRLQAIYRRSQDLGRQLTPGSPHGLALTAAVRAVKDCAIEWSGDDFIWSPLKPQPRDGV